MRVPTFTPTPPIFGPFSAITRRISPLRRPSRRVLPVIRCCAEPVPVEDGITLPSHPSIESLQDECAWLANEITSWLDEEWRSTTTKYVHTEIGQRIAQIYVRQRMEGEDDLSSVLLAIGSELEGMDLSDAFVGPWNVANKTSELLLKKLTGREVAYREVGEDGIQWSKDMEIGGKEEKVDNGVVKAVNLADRFERMMFLRFLLDGDINKQEINGAIAMSVGFEYDESSGKWNGSEVKDEFFKGFGNEPPDIVGIEDDENWTESLRYLEERINVDDEDGKIADGLEMVMETMHGVELYRVMKEEAEVGFMKRVVIAKWLHLYAGF